MAKIDKLIKQAEEHLDADETIEVAALGSYETKILGEDSLRTGIFAATSSRLIFYAKKLGGYELESFPYSNISSFEMGKSMMGQTLSFFASGNSAKMKWINAGDPEKLVETVQARMGKRATPPSVGSSDPVGQLKKLAEMNELGLISPEEFEAKKTEILARM